MSKLIKVLIVKDHRPGHFNQSEGIAQAIGRISPVSIQYITVKRRFPLSWRFIYLIYNIGFSSEVFFNGLVAADGNVKSAPDVIISSGGDTLLYNVLLARRYKCQNIFSGSTRNLKLDLFSCIFTPYRRYAQQRPYLHGLKPCPLDPDVLPGPGPAQDFCFLIGGPSGTHSYSEDDWRRLLRLVQQLSEKFSVSVFTSRRTPSRIVTAMKALEREGVAIFDATEIRAPQLFDYCKRSRAIFVTEDSNSMITEAVCCKKPVVVLAPPTNRMNEDEKGYLQDLAENGWLVRQVLDMKCSVERLLATLDTVQPMSFNHLDVLAAKLQQVLQIEPDPQMGDVLTLRRALPRGVDEA